MKWILCQIGGDEATVGEYTHCTLQYGSVWCLSQCAKGACMDSNVEVIGCHLLRWCNLSPIDSFQIHNLRHSNMWKRA